MDPITPTTPVSGGSLTHVGAPATGTPEERRAGCAGDICVFFEPSVTLVRLYGRVDIAMRKELVEAAFDVVDRGAPVTIEFAPDADVQQGVLQFLGRVRELSIRGAAVAQPSCVPTREGLPADAGRRPAPRRLAQPRTGTASGGG